MAVTSCFPAPFSPLHSAAAAFDPFGPSVTSATDDLSSLHFDAVPAPAATNPAFPGFSYTQAPAPVPAHAHMFGGELPGAESLVDLDDLNGGKTGPKSGSLAPRPSMNQIIVRAGGFRSL